MEQWEKEYREKLNREISIGSYFIGTKDFPCYTGKGGYIEFMVAMKKELIRLEITIENEKEPMKTFIIANSYKEHYDYLFSINTKKEEIKNYRYVRDLHDIRGYDPRTINTKVIIVNKHRLSDDKYELIGELENRGFKLEEFIY